MKHLYPEPETQSKCKNANVSSDTNSKSINNSNHKSLSSIKKSINTQTAKRKRGKIYQFLPTFNCIIFSLLTIFSIINQFNGALHSNSNVLQKQHHRQLMSGKDIKEEKYSAEQSVIPEKNEITEVDKEMKDCTDWLQAFQARDTDYQKNILWDRTYENITPALVKKKQHSFSLLSGTYTLQSLSFKEIDDKYTLVAMDGDIDVNEIEINWKTDIDTTHQSIVHSYVIKLRCDKYCTQGKNNITYQFMNIRMETKEEHNTLVCTLKLIKKMDEMKHTRVDCKTVFWEKSEIQKKLFYDNWIGHWLKRKTNIGFLSNIIDNKRFWKLKKIRFSSENVIEVKSYFLKKENKLIRKQINYKTGIFTSTKFSNQKSINPEIYIVKLRFKPIKFDVNIGGFGTNSMVFKTSSKTDRDLFACAARAIKFACIQVKYSSKISDDFRLMNGEIDLEKVSEIFRNADSSKPIYSLLKYHKKLLSKLKWQRRGHIMITILGKAVDLALLLIGLLSGDASGIYGVFGFLVDLDENVRGVLEVADEIEMEQEHNSIAKRVFTSLGQILADMFETFTSLNGQKFTELSSFDKFLYVKKYVRVICIVVTIVLPVSAPATAVILLLMTTVDLTWHTMIGIKKLNDKFKGRNLFKETFGKIKSKLSKKRKKSKKDEDKQPLLTFLEVLDERN